MAALASLISETDDADPASAFEWARQSVALDSARGNMVMGDFHFYGGAGQPVDFAKARQHWAKAMELDSRYELADRIAWADSALSEDSQTRTAAQMAELGMKYQDAIERPFNPQRAKLWLLRAVAAGTTNREAVFRLADLQESEGQYREAAATYGRLTAGQDRLVGDSRAAIARLQSTGKIAAPAVAAAPAPRAVASAKPAPAAAARKPAAPAAPKASGSARVPVGRQLICEMKSWSGYPSIGLYSRDKQTRYDDAFRVEFLSRTQIRISGSDKLTNGVRNIVVQGGVAIISDPYPQTNGLLGVTFRNISPFTFNIGSLTFREEWTSSLGANTIYEGNCE